MELRYPISLNPQSTIFVTSFSQGGNAWGRAQDFNPFDIKRSVGLGLRVFLPMFGTLGFDYGIDIDKPELYPSRKFSDYARFNIVLGLSRISVLDLIFCGLNHRPYTRAPGCVCI